MAGSLAKVFLEPFKRAAILLASCTLLSACSGGGGGDAGSDAPTAPVISNFTFAPAVLYVGGGDVPFFGTVDFTDPDGDIASATVEIVDSSGGLIATASIPVAGVSGVRSGTLTGEVSGDTSTAGTFTARVSVVDRAGLRSNWLTASVRISEFPWVSRRAMPLPRRDFATATVNGRIYVLGGGDTQAPVIPSPATTTVQVYDPATDSWTMGAPLLVAVMSHAAAAVDGKIYVAGGKSEFAPGLKTLQVYDPITRLWTRKADLPYELSDSAATGAGGKLFIFGGDGLGWDTSNTLSYDPAIDAWSAHAPMPDVGRDMAAIAVDGKPLVLGGYGSMYVPDAGYYRSMHQYDPGADAWTPRADMFTPRSDFAVALLGGRVYAVGGGNWDRALADVASYDPVSDAWAGKTALPQGLPWPRAEAVNGRMYVFDTGVTLEYTPANDIL